MVGVAQSLQQQETAEQLCAGEGVEIQMGLMGITPLLCCGGCSISLAGAARLRCGSL